MSYNSVSDTGGGADMNFFFNGFGGTVSAEVEGALAGNAAFNAFGWYDMAIGKCDIAITGGLAGDLFNFTPSSQWGLCFQGVGGTQDLWFSQSSLNSSGQKSNQHFAVFNEGGGVYWIGAEDSPFSSADKDYNDLILRIQTTTPEPGSLALLGSGLMGLAGFVRRRRK